MANSQKGCHRTTIPSGQGPGNTSQKVNDAAFVKIKQNSSSNYYACISTPQCQVKEHEPSTTHKSTIKFKTPINIAPTVPPDYVNKIAQRWTRKLANRKSSQQHRARMAETIANAYELPPAPRRYIIGNDDDALCQGIIDGTIPSTVANSGCTSNVGTSNDPS